MHGGFLYATHNDENNVLCDENMKVKEQERGVGTDYKEVKEQASSTNSKSHPLIKK